MVETLVQQPLPPVEITQAFGEITEKHNLSPRGTTSVREELQP